MKKLLFLCLLLPLFSISQPITDGLIGYWPMGTNPHDYSGRGNDGILTGVTPAEGRTRESNTAYNFEVGQYISIGDRADYDFGSNEFSVSIWVKRTTIPNSWDNQIIGKWATSSVAGQNEWNLGIGHPNGTLYPNFAIEINSSTYSVSSFEELELNQWYHIVAIRKSTSIELYVNGILTENLVIPDSAINNVNGRELYFGRIDGTGTPITMNGCIMDEAMIFNRALSAEEVNILYRDGSPIANSNLPSSLIGYWPLGANSFDYSGEGNDGVLYGATPVEGRDREAATAYDFNGSEYVSMGDPAEYDFGSNEFSVSMWIYRTAGTVNNDGFLVGKWNVGSNLGSNEWCLSAMTNTADDIPAFAVEMGNTIYVTNSTTAISLNQWHHIVALRKAEAIEIYIDGILVGNAVIPNSPINNISGRVLDLGRFNNNGTFRYLDNCRIDETMIFNKALSAEEITSLYREGSPIANSNLPSGLIGYWPMDTDPYDYSGSGNDAILHGPLTHAEDRHRSIGAYDFQDPAGGEYLDIGDPTEYDFGTSEFSLSVWIYPTKENPNTHQAIMGKYNTSLGAANNEWLLKGGVGQHDWFPNFKVAIGSSVYEVSSNTEMDLNKWHHIVAIRKTNSIELHLDGILAASASIPSGAINNVSGLDFLIGRHLYGATGTSRKALIAARLDDAMIYNKALSAEEINSLHRDGGPLAESNLPSGLVGYWPMGKNSFDYSGSENDGLITGAPTPVTDKNGIESSAYFFNRLDMIDVGDVSEYNFGNNEFTISVWVNRAKKSEVNYDKFIMGKGCFACTEGDNGWVLMYGTHALNVPYKPTFRVEVGTQLYTLNSISEVEVDNWHHIVALRRGDVIELYLDGILQSNLALPAGASINDAGNMLIGRSPYANTGWRYLDSARLDEAMIFGRALSVQEIDQLGSITPGSTSGSSFSFANIYEDGADVGIGTTDAHGYKLAVAGKVIAEEVKVALQANWPDYVFDSEYELKSLEEIQQYIEKNKHLPGIPPASEIEASGISLGEMNANLLKKIEELTLYQISLLHHIKGQEGRIEELQKELEELRKSWGE